MPIITYVPLQSGFMYLTVVLDWYSRYVLSWRLSNTLDGDFCLQALEEAPPHGLPATACSCAVLQMPQPAGGYWHLAASPPYV
jgi:transposase InsO family protein